MPKRVLLSFADSGLRNSLKRIERQASEMGVFDDILICDEHSLSPAFRKQFRRRLRPGSRGYGYWCWKPQIILQSLRKMEDADTLLYVDAGCHFNVRGQKRLVEYFEMADRAKTGVVGFQAVPPQPPLDAENCGADGWLDVAWTKGDLIDHFGVRDNEAILRTPTIVATLIVFRKCGPAIRLLEKWRAVFSEDFSLVDDTPSISPNYPEFNEHRHDQAAFSLLGKLAGIDTISAFETWYPAAGSSLQHHAKPDWDALRDFPIHAMRDKPRSRGSRKLISVQKRIRALSDFLTASKA